jgi:Cell wall-active antibiotics response 4TMS YvqF
MTPGSSDAAAIASVDLRRKPGLTRSIRDGIVRRPWNNRDMTRRSLMRGSIRALLLVVIAGVVGQLLSKRLTKGDEESEEFQLAAVVGGKEFRSRATALRSASVLAVVGGVEVDLREATLHPAGATLDVSTIVGGAQVLLPSDCVADVETRGRMGGVDTQLGEAADRPEGAPTLRVTTSTWLGGVQISQQ